MVAFVFFPVTHKKVIGFTFSSKSSNNLSHTKNQRGQSSELRANLISCAPGELNKAVDGRGTEGGRGCERAVSWRGLQFRGRSRWIAGNQTAAVINSAREFNASRFNWESGTEGTQVHYLNIFLRNNSV